MHSFTLSLVPCLFLFKFTYLSCPDMLPLVIINQERVMHVLNARLTLSTPLSTKNSKPERGSMNTVSFSLRLQQRLRNSLLGCYIKYCPTFRSASTNMLPRGSMETRYPCSVNNMALCILVHHAFDFFSLV